jgi:ribosome-binding factor A
MSHRAERVAEEIRLALSDILRRKMHDPRVSLASISEVDLSPDLRHARVYVSALDDAERREEAVAGLRHAAGFLRRELGRSLRLRYVPELAFLPDLVEERAGRIEEALARSLSREEPARSGSDPAPEAGDEEPEG